MAQMTTAAWQQTLALAKRDNLAEADIMALAVGCPVHGNAGMDWDSDGVFCHQCQ